MTVHTATAEYNGPAPMVLHMDALPSVGDRIVNDGPPARLWGEVVSLAVRMGGITHDNDHRAALLRWCAPPDDERRHGDLPAEGVTFGVVLCTCGEDRP